MTYKYSNSHLVTSAFRDLGVPTIPSPFRDSQFTLVLRNIGSFDATIYFIGALGELTIQYVPSGNDGIVLKDMPYDMVAGGVAGQTVSASSDVFISILEQARSQVVNVQPVAGLAIVGDADERATFEEIVTKI